MNTLKISILTLLTLPVVGFGQATNSDFNTTIPPAITAGQQHVQAGLQEHAEQRTVQTSCPLFLSNTGRHEEVIFTEANLVAAAKRYKENDAVQTATRLRIAAENWKRGVQMVHDSAQAHGVSKDYLATLDNIMTNSTPRKPSALKQFDDAVAAENAALNDASDPQFVADKKLLLDAVKSSLKLDVPCIIEFVQITSAGAHLYLKVVGTHTLP